MNDSEKARELSRVAHVKFKRYAEAVAGQLDERPFLDGNPGSNERPNTFWQEWKLWLDGRSSSPCVLLGDAIRTACANLLLSLPYDEHCVLWLGSSAAEGADRLPPPLPLLARSLASKLEEQVTHLAREQIRIEQSFGAGFFADEGDEILGVVEDVIREASQRLGLSGDVTANLQRLLSMVQALPEEIPSEAMKLTLCYSVDREISGGSQNYSLGVFPDSFEITSGGDEWTKVGTDSWSGPRLEVGVTGGCSRDGDTEELLYEMLDAAADPDYEISVECDD